MNINGLMFEKTCDCCPEQYDIINGRGQQVGYVRLRWGHLTCDYPDVGGEEIYSATIGDGAWTGCFTSEEERMHHLNAIAYEINRQQKRNGSKHKKYYGKH